jgi:penicillin amidase
VTANNAVADPSYGYLLGTDFDPGYRAERIIGLIDGFGQDGLTVPEIGTIQNDTAPARAQDIVGLVSELGAAPSTADGQLVAARIADWDGSCEVDSAGCAAYMTWEYLVERGLLDDELGSLARDYVGSPTSWVALTNLLSDPTSSWWDDATTSDVTETAATVVAAAMDAAGAGLRGVLGDPDRWTWGRLHTATFREATIGTASGIGPLEWYYNAGPAPVAGAAGAIDNTYYQLGRAYPDPDDPEAEVLGLDRLFTVTNLPSYRLAIDMGDLDGARIVITTGQAGNPFDRHYTDQIDPWRSGGSLPLPFTPAAIERATTATLSLTP